MSRLLELDQLEGWSGSRDLVPATSIVCAWCGPTFDITHYQPALFIDGGYGATEGRRIRGCECGAIQITTVWPVNPKR